MRIQVLGAHGGESPNCRMTCLLVGDAIALDAGSLAEALPISRQERVRSIVLTHSHMDHTSSLPFFIENVYGTGDGTIHIYGSEATIYALRRHLFNNATWPDFTRIPNHLLPSVQFHELADEVTVEIEGVRFTPIPVNHLVPTYGFLIEHGGAAVLWSSDTGPTQRFWEVANRTRNLAALFIETSFPNAMQHVADLSLHLTPQTLGQELTKLESEVPVYVHHLKPPYLETLRREIEELGHPRLKILEEGTVFDV